MPEGPNEQPIPAAILTPSPMAPPPQPRRRSRWATFFVVLLVLALGGSLLVNFGFISLFGMAAIRGQEAGVQEEYVSHSRWSAKKIAILSIDGMIVDGEGFFKKQLDRARKDAQNGSLKALVLRINSPGGTISGSDRIYCSLRKFADETQTPIVVSMGALAASGGYYAAMAVGETPDSIFAERTTWTGSIGVIIPHYNLGGLMKQYGVEADNVVSYRLKEMGTIARSMTEEERKIFQQLVDEGFSRFKEVVKEGRPKLKKDLAALDAAATGQVFTADQAVKRGLVDRIGFEEDAVARAIELAKLVDKDDVTVIRYKAEPSLRGLLFGEQGRASSFDPSALLDLATPKAYYLFTWLPPMTKE